MDARNMRIWNRYGLDNASSRRGMILRQLDDNKCMWLDACKTKPCISPFIASNAHSSQAAGSGAHDSSDQDGQPDHTAHEELLQWPRHSVRTVRAELTVANAHLARSDLKVQGERRSWARHHPAPHPVGGEQHQDTVTVLSILPFTARVRGSDSEIATWWIAIRAGQTIGLTATQ